MENKPDIHAIALEAMKFALENNSAVQHVAHQFRVGTDTAIAIVSYGIAYEMQRIGSMDSRLYGALIKDLAEKAKPLHEEDDRRIAEVMKRREEEYNNREKSWLEKIFG
jgi:hypothetical protein